jgi:hypothetical protein
MMLVLAALLVGCAPVTNSSEPKDAIIASYELFEDQGVTESITNEEGSWVLVFDPSLDHPSAWFEKATGESELIVESDYFSVFVAYQMLSDRDFEITKTQDGFSAESSRYSRIDFVVKDGLIVGAGSDEFEPWTSTISYQVSEENRSNLIKLGEQRATDS